ncbi:glycosyltransferase family 2 protein [Streptococcus gallinaceus]|uniref:Rhamnosyltransferase n=1 Tax=Streptococcus gallinaceus TaxID=165758 RepID=A0ABV2JJ50_9STRE|nr:glycosyltransferase family 2 protein [Streptococcus gallinaceus]MCP1639094.1 rhamnosyltransferase [Streptococcus gallinaceus]MCP1769662.1 rhamnosyltransferase [Streptococcus gallinaceus]
MKINILMSTYNGERFIAEQIRSIQEQTVTDWTLLIRDDGSSDQTPEIIQAFAQEDSRIRFINARERKNYGVIKNFYTLLKYEEADLYFFSDQDDIWLPEKIAMTLAEADHYSAEEPLLIYTDLKVVNQDLKVSSESMIRSQSHHANTQLVQELTENTVTGGTMMINHSLAQLWQGDEEILMHDWYLALLAAAFGKLVYIDKAGELYRQHDSNVLGARTLSKRMQNWIRPQLLFSKYWSLIKGTQLQARYLLSHPLSPENREMVQAFVDIMEKGFLERARVLRRYGFRKNKAFHTFVFTVLILTKFAYKE